MKKYACILAAGKGSRLKDITLNRSKWMIEVNKITLMERYLKAFKACKYLNTVEEDFKKRNEEYNKLRRK